MQRQPRQQSFAMRIVLALLLSVAPLLGYASPAPDPAAVATDGAQMPCHASEIVEVGPADCPHCNDEAAAGPCQCCGWMAPAALPVIAHDASAPGAGLDRWLSSGMERWPDSPKTNPFRPPILTI